MPNALLARFEGAPSLVVLGAEAQFEAILARQTPDSEKRRRADFVINTGLGLDYAQAQVDAVITALRARAVTTQDAGGTGN